MAGPLTPVCVTSKPPRSLKPVPGTETSADSTETPASSRNQGAAIWNVNREGTGIYSIIVRSPRNEIEQSFIRFGRVKVQFFWDRVGKEDENSSCSVRVSQAWAGRSWGAMWIPRIGQEVIVEFLEGDPDRPIITGRVYNADQEVPYTLPDNGTRSTLLSRSSKGGGSANFNEIRFEDKKDSEQIFINAEKDMDLRVEKESREFVGANRHLIVKEDQKEKVEGSSHSEIVKNSNQKIGQDMSLKVDGNRQMEITGDQKEKFGGSLHSEIGAMFNQKVGANMSLNVGAELQEKSGVKFAHEAGAEIHLKAGASVVIEAGAELTLKVGGSFIRMNPAEISIQAPMVLINSGGAAGARGAARADNPQGRRPRTHPGEKRLRARGGGRAWSAPLPGGSVPPDNPTGVKRLATGRGPAVNQPRDAGMLQPRQDPPLRRQALLQPGIGVSRAQQLEGHHLGKPLAGPLRQIHDSHAPFTDLANQPVGPHPFQMRCARRRRVEAAQRPGRLVGGEQHLHLVQQRGVSAARAVEKRASLARVPVQRPVQQRLDALPPFRRHGCAAPLISRLSHARAATQSRFTVAGDVPSASAVCSTSMPAKKRHSTTRACRWFNRDRRASASSSATSSSGRVVAASMAFSIGTNPRSAPPSATRSRTSPIMCIGSSEAEA